MTSLFGRRAVAVFLTLNVICVVFFFLSGRRITEGEMVRESELAMQSSEGSVSDFIEHGLETMTTAPSAWCSIREGSLRYMRSPKTGSSSILTVLEAAKAANPRACENVSVELWHDVVRDHIMQLAGDADAMPAPVQLLGLIPPALFLAGTTSAPTRPRSTAPRSPSISRSTST